MISLENRQCKLRSTSTHNTVKIPKIGVSFPSLLKIYLILFLAALFSLSNFAHLLKQKTDCFYIKALRWLFSSLILISVPHVPKSSPTNNHSFFRTILKNREIAIRDMSPFLRQMTRAFFCLKQSSNLKMLHHGCTTFTPCELRLMSKLIRIAIRSYFIIEILFLNFAVLSWLFCHVNLLYPHLTSIMNKVSNFTCILSNF